MEIVSIRTLDEITLKGLFFENIENQNMCLFIPGCAGNFLENDFIYIIAKHMFANGYNILCANTRGSFMMNSSFHPLNLEKPKKIGVFNEKFEDSVYDIDAWISYLRDLGYDSINIITHSSGANKLIFYLSNNPSNKQFIKNIIMLSPPDFMNRIRCYEDYFDLIKEAKENVENGKPDKLIKVHFFYKTSEGFLEMITNKNFDNIPLVHGGEEDFKMFSQIDKPITVIYGQNERYIKNFIYKLENFAHSKAEFESHMIEDTDHIYFGKELDVANAIMSNLNKKISPVKKKIK